MSTLEGRGHVVIANTRFLIISHTQGNVYVPQSVTQSKHKIGDDLQFRATYFDPERQPSTLIPLKVKYKATTAYWAGVAEKIDDYACISYVSTKIDGYLMKYGKDDIFCARDLCSDDLQLGDIVHFTAESWNNPPQVLSSKGVRYKALTLEFVSKPEAIVADGYFSLIDSKGNFGYVETYAEEIGRHVQCYVTVNSVYPPCTNLNERFTQDTLVRFLAVEQAANKKNNLTRFKATVATDENYVIQANGDVVSAPSQERKSTADSRRAAGDSSSSSVSTSGGTLRLSENLPQSTGSTVPQPIGTGRKSSPADSSKAKSEPEPSKKSSDEFARVSCIMYDEARSAMEEENRKLRVLAHFAMDFKTCGFCLTHNHPPIGTCGLRPDSQN